MEPRRPPRTHRVQKEAPMSKNHETELARLRARVRTILLEQGTALSPRGQTPDAIDTLISAKADRECPKLDPRSRALVQRIKDTNDWDLANAVSDQFGAHMVAYGDSGYHVGLATGLELAALIAGPSVTCPVRRIRRARKAGAR
jgi:hypothetical protein